jgi:hypothetical protein
MRGAAAQLHLSYPRPPCENRAGECGHGESALRKHPGLAGRAGTAARLAPTSGRPPGRLSDPAAGGLLCWIIVSAGEFTKTTWTT